MSATLLSSKIAILETEPQIPSIVSVLSAVLLLEGVTERGPINDPQIVTSFDEYERMFGGFTTANEVAMATYGFFLNGGSYAWVNRIVHYTDLTDPAAHTAAKGTVTLTNTGSLATAASETTTATEPFNLRSETLLTLDFTTDLGGPTTVTLTAVAATITSGAGTYNFGAGGQTLTFKVDQGPVQTVTFVAGDFSVPAAGTADEVALVINLNAVGLHADGSTGSVVLTSDKRGSGSHLEITGGAANALLGFSTTEVDGSGNVADLAAVTGAELEAIVEGAVADIAATVNGDGTVTFATAATGAAKTLQVVGTSGLDTALGLDNVVHSGAAAAPANTIKVDGRYFGDYTDDITIQIANATSGVASEFNLLVIRGGVVKEVFPNVTMDDTATNYVETVVNDENSGSVYIAVTDLDAGGTPTTDRPINITSSALAGGDAGTTSLADADYVGNQAGPTGLYAFDRVSDGTMLVIPNASSSLAGSMLEYSYSHRNGSLFCFLDPPAGYTAAQIVSWVTSGNLLENTAGEFGAVFWPRIKVANPATAIFGSAETITVPPSAWIAGRAAANDAKIGGVYQPPAGIGEGYGVVLGMRGVEDDPGGSSRHPVLDENVRDLVYPKRINPITKIETTPWHIDGSKTMKSTGSFPTIGERRGVIFIEQTIKGTLQTFRHRANNAETRRKVKNTVERFLEQEMGYGAFRSTDPATAFFVDCSDALNPLSLQRQGKLRCRVGLATNSPIDFIILEFTQDTRGLETAA